MLLAFVPAVAAQQPATHGAPSASPATTSSAATRDEQLWAEIQEIVRRPPATQPFDQQFAARVEQQRDLIERARLYRTLYPGGAHADEAVRLEFGAMFEAGTFAGGDYRALCAQAEEMRREPPGRAALHEAAYWCMMCARIQRPDERIQAASAPAVDADRELLEAYAEYVRAYPTSRYAPRLSMVLFEAARAAADRARMRALVEGLEQHFPAHASTAALRGRLRREEAQGEAFRLVVQPAEGPVIDTADLAGQIILIVVWAGRDARAASCVRDVEEFRRRNPAVRVLGVNLDRTRDEMGEYVCELAIDWPQLHDGLGFGGEFPRHWGLSSTPCVFVIGRDGRIDRIAESSACLARVQQLLAAN
jgi:hypothetical protein